MWGNRFTHRPELAGGAHGLILVESRSTAVRAYDSWLHNPDQAELLRLARETLQGKVLGCWCKPRACHGDVLARVANEAAAEAPVVFVQEEPARVVAEDARSAGAALVRALVTRDIVMTWPKTRTLASYVAELRRAVVEGLVINYRVPSVPKVEIQRCYMVHDGQIRGWMNVLNEQCGWRDDVVDPVTGVLMKPGLYIVRDPHWHPMTYTRPMRGFQGWRYMK
jgi:hypothetical protein